ncbi:MAG: hypothetical protein ACPGU1_15715 [Myxococcota bacterium]
MGGLYANGTDDLKASPRRAHHRHHVAKQSPDEGVPRPELTLQSGGVLTKREGD